MRDDAGDQPAVGKRPHRHESGNSDDQRDDRCEQQVQIEHTLRHAKGHGACRNRQSKPHKQQQLHCDEMQFEPEIRPGYLQACAGDQIVHDPMDAACDARQNWLGHVGFDNVLIADEIVLDDNLPIRSSHGGGPGGHLAGLDGEIAKCELRLPQRAGSFELAAE